MRRKLLKNVDLDEPTSFLDHVHFGCTRRECKTNESIFDETEKCSNRESPPEQLKNYQGGRNLTQTLSRGPTTWKVMGRSAWKDMAWRSCPEMCGAILRAGEQNHPATVQSHNSMP